MSTRANIIIKDGRNELMFYRHSDGYPSGALPTLCKFMQWRVENRIRDNVEQASGWLILIGAKEYDTAYDFEKHKDVRKKTLFEPDAIDEGMGWKAGAYEPSTGIHGDIEFLYTLDIGENLSILVESVDRHYDKHFKFRNETRTKLDTITDFYKDYSEVVYENS